MVGDAALVALRRQAVRFSQSLWGTSMKYFVLLQTLVLTPLVALTVASSAAAVGPVTLTLYKVGSTSFPLASVGTDTSTKPDEIDAAMNGDTDSGRGRRPGHGCQPHAPRREDRQRQADFAER